MNFFTLEQDDSRQTKQSVKVERHGRLGPNSPYFIVSIANPQLIRGGKQFALMSRQDLVALAAHILDVAGCSD